MRERGTLQETADWLDTQFATFLGLLDQATSLLSDAWEAIQPENLAQLPQTLPSLVLRELSLVAGVGLFAGTVLLEGRSSSSSTRCSACSASMPTRFRGSG